MGNRHFERFRCNMRWKYLIGEREVWEEECSFTFVCAFSLRALESCCRIYRFLPRRFLRLSVSFELDNKDPITEYEYLNRCANYDSVQEHMLRELIFSLTLNSIIHYEKDINCIL